MISDESREWLRYCEAIAGMAPDDLLARLDALPPQTRRAALRARLRVDLPLFARLCFPEVCIRPFNAYHRHVMSARKVRWSERITLALPMQRDVQAAPRGIAKSTTEQLSCVHDVVYGLEAYTLIIGPSETEGNEWSTSLRALLTSENELYRWLYGEVTLTRGVEDFVARAPGVESCKFRFASSRTQIRGTKHGHIRPTKIILDDYDNRSRVRNPELRAVDADFITKDALKAGAAGGVGLTVRCRGTVYYVESQIAKMLERRAPHRGWTGRRWQAVQSWPERQDLWEQCGRIGTNLQIVPTPEQAARLASERPDLDDDQIATLHRERVAEQFYTANRAEMNRGAVVLDPVALPIFRVYATIWSEGWSSVLSELQNEARDPTTQVFDRSRLHRCAVTLAQANTRIRNARGHTVRLADCAIRLRWDPVPGQTQDGDFAAIGVIARDPDGYRYLLGAWMARGSATAQLEAAWNLAESFRGYRARVLGVYESNGFDITESQARIVAERKAAGRWAGLELIPQRQNRNKEERIGAMEVPLSNGWLQIADSIPEECIAQLEAWRPDGSADHDDFPDMLAGADGDIGHGATGMVNDPERRIV